MTWIDYAVLLVYFTTMIGIGLWAMKRVKDQEDYFMGGRGFGKLLQTFAAFGAGTGAHEPVQVGRTCWTSGLSGVWSALMWLFVTPVYWITAVWYRRMRHLTLGDWFVERYESKGLGAAYSIFAILFYMFYLSTMLSAIAKFAVPLMGIDEVAGVDLKYLLIPGLAGIVIVYGVLGGLTAAYWTDLIQGVFIILLSVLLIPFGLWELVKNFGDPTTQGFVDGFTILHERVPSDFFSLFTGPAAGEFPPQYIISLTILGLVGIVVQPHFIATGGGSAKSENEARIGLVVGNFLKRLCTVGWALTALIALALLAGSAEIATDPGTFEPGISGSDARLSNGRHDEFRRHLHDRQLGTDHAKHLRGLHRPGCFRITERQSRPLDRSGDYRWCVDCRYHHGRRVCSVHTGAGTSHLVCGAVLDRHVLAARESNSGMDHDRVFNDLLFRATDCGPADLSWDADRPPMDDDH